MRFHRRSRLVRRVLVYGLGGLVALGVAWLVVTGLLARHQLAALQDRLARVQVLIATGHVAQARQLAQGVPAMGRHAHDLTTGPAWWVAAQVPGAGTPATVIRGSSAAAQRLSTQVVPRLVDVATRIDPGTLRLSGSKVDIAAIASAAPDLRSSAASVDDAAAYVDGLPAHSWLAPVDRARSALAGELTQIKGYTDAAARVSQVLPTMLGRDGTQTYFVGLQNEAEARGTGGLPGAFAILTATNGTVHFSHFYSDTALLPVAGAGLVPTGLDFGAEYARAYGASTPTSSYVDSNVSPDFPYAAQIWAAMWQRVSGQRIDGVIAVDPTALGYFLGAVGPVALPGGGVLTAANVVPLTERDQYSLYPDVAQRKNFVVSVLRAAADQLTSGTGSAVAVVRAASTGAAQQRLAVWSRSPDVERVLSQSSYAGRLPASDRPFAGVIVNNAAAGKLDYYLRRSLSYSRTGCGADRDVLATISLTDDAPATGLPSYVTTRLDKAPPGAKPGDSRVLLDYYATDGAVLQSVTRNGVRATATTLSVSGHEVFRLDVELPRGQTQTIVLHLSEPAGHGSPVIWKQPGVTPLAVQEFSQSC